MRFSWKTLLKGLGKCWKFKKSQELDSLFFYPNIHLSCARLTWRQMWKQHSFLHLLSSDPNTENQTCLPWLEYFAFFGLVFLIIYLFIFLLSAISAAVASAVWHQKGKQDHWVCGCSTNLCPLVLRARNEDKWLQVTSRQVASIQSIPEQSKAYLLRDAPVAL